MADDRWQPTAGELATRLGLSRAGRSWRGDCPSCGYADAFVLSQGRGVRPLLWCANGCAGIELQAAASNVAGGAWWPSPAEPATTAAAARQATTAAALRVWNGAEPATGTPADAYLTHRALPGLAASPALRFRGDCMHPEGGRRPAMVAVVVDAAGHPVAVHRTYLTHDGRKANVTPQKASKGPVWGGAIRLDGVATELVIGEGIETSASAGQLLGLPAWSAISAGNLGAGLILPPDVRAVVIAADSDRTGEDAARTAAERWQAEGRAVRIARPTGGGDFNDVLRRRGCDAAGR